MEPALIDTDVLSLFMRNDRQVVIRFGEYLALHETVHFSIVSFYEIMSGLEFRDAHRQRRAFEQLAAQSIVIPLTIPCVTVAAELYARLRKAGTPVDDIDLLIAGTAIAHGLTVVTHNVRHFERIQELSVVDWTV